MDIILDFWPIVALPLGWLFAMNQQLKKEIEELRKEKDKDVSELANAMSDASASISKRLDDLMLELMRRKS